MAKMKCFCLDVWKFIFWKWVRRLLLRVGMKEICVCVCVWGKWSFWNPKNIPVGFYP